MKYYVAEAMFGFPTISLTRPEDLSKVIGFGTSEKEAEEIAISYMQRTREELIQRTKPNIDSVLESIMREDSNSSFIDELMKGLDNPSIDQSEEKGNQ